MLQLPLLPSTIDPGLPRRFSRLRSTYLRQPTPLLARPRLWLLAQLPQRHLLKPLGLEPLASNRGCIPKWKTLRTSTVAAVKYSKIPFYPKPNRPLPLSAPGPHQKDQGSAESLVWAASPKQLPLYRCLHQRRLCLDHRAHSPQFPQSAVMVLLSQKVFRSSGPTRHRQVSQVSLAYPVSPPSQAHHGARLQV